MCVCVFTFVYGCVTKYAGVSNTDLQVLSCQIGAVNPSYVLLKEINE